MSIPAIVSLTLLLLCGGLSASEPQAERQSFLRPFCQAARFRSQGEFEKSLSSLHQALNASRWLSPAYQGKCLIRLGILKWDLGDVPAAERYFGEAAKTFQEAGDSKAQELCVKCLAVIDLFNSGKNDRRERYYHRAAERLEKASLLGRETGIPDLQLKCLRQLALAYLDMHKLDLFLENAERGLGLAAGIRHLAEQGRCLNNIGVYHQQRADYSQAIAVFEEALSLSRRAGDQATEAECLNNLGLIYRELGNLGRAQFYISGALSLDQAIGNVRSIPLDQGNLGSVLVRRGIDTKNKKDLRLALEAFQGCFSSWERDGGDPVIGYATLNNMGIILNELGDHGGARRHFARALEVVDPEKQALEKCQVLTNIATSYLDEQNVGDALPLYGSALEIGARHSFEHVLMESCCGLGQCHEQLQDPESAISYYRRAIEALEGMRSRVSSEPLMIGFARNKFGVYERAMHILAGRYARQPSAESLEEVFDLMERAKARAFLESVYDARLDIAASELTVLEKRQGVVSQNISKLAQSLEGQAVTEEARRILKNELELEEEEYVRLISEMKAAGRAPEDRWQNALCRMSDIRQLLLAEKAVLLEYFLGEERSYLLSISASGGDLHILPDRMRIESSLRGYLKSISDGRLDPRAGFEAAERIGRELVPLDEADKLGTATALIVIPDGILNHLPFEALKIRDGLSSRYLVEEMRVSYCPSASSLAVLKSIGDRGNRPKALLAVGGPSYKRVRALAGGVPLSRRDPSVLPFSKKEVVDISKLFSKDEVDILAGDSADERTIKKLTLDNYRIIHFACHGFLNGQHPFRSALILTPTDAPAEDGFLQMREIYGLSLKADLVVLSACQTGQGLLERSEGSMGLARPFFFAGARSVIASLWSINDRATATFMQEFYRHFTGGLTAAEALRLTKRRMIGSRQAHPYYWASFMLQGDPSVAKAANRLEDATRPGKSQSGPNRTRPESPRLNRP